MQVRDDSPAILLIEESFNNTQIRTASTLLFNESLSIPDELI